MLCPACSADVAAGSTFCPKCGHRVGEPVGAPGASAAPSAAEQLRSGNRPAPRGDDPEQQLWHGSYSPKAMYGSWLLAGVATIVAVVVSILIPTPVTWLAAGAIVVVLWLSLLGYLLYERLSVEYTLTNHRFIHQTGIFRRVTNRVETIDIDDVTFEQGLIERMFGVGTIKLLSSDTSDPKLYLKGIDDVKRVANLIDDARRDERRKRGMYIESV